MNNEELEINMENRDCDSNNGLEVAEDDLWRYF